MQTCQPTSAAANRVDRKATHPRWFISARNANALWYANTPPPFPNTSAQTPITHLPAQAQYPTSSSSHLITTTGRHQPAVLGRSTAVTSIPKAISTSACETFLEKSSVSKSAGLHAVIWRNVWIPKNLYFRIFSNTIFARIDLERLFILAAPA